MLINYTEGHPGHGWVQQDPSRGWLDPNPVLGKEGRWLFLGGTSINGSEANPNGVSIIELFGSKVSVSVARVCVCLYEFRLITHRISDSTLTQCIDLSVASLGWL